LRTSTPTSTDCGGPAITASRPARSRRAHRLDGGGRESSDGDLTQYFQALRNDARFPKPS
jgi:hypothetical protein